MGRDLVYVLEAGDGLRLLQPLKARPCGNDDYWARDAVQQSAEGAAGREVLRRLLGCSQNDIVRAILHANAQELIPEKPDGHLGFHADASGLQRLRERAQTRPRLRNSLRGPQRPGSAERAFFVSQGHESDRRLDNVDENDPG